MEKLKTILSKYGFWIACNAIVLVAIGVWYLSCGKLEKEFAQQQSSITSKISTVRSLSSKQAHPNQHSHEQMDALNDNVMQLVLNAWQRQFSHQESILVWPRELRADFVSAVRPLKPIEAKVNFPTPPTQELKIDYKSRYANYVANLLPRLATEVGANWQTSRRAALTKDEEARQAAADAKLLVEWSSQDQARLLASHFNWSKQRDGRPSTLQILYAQEDLWVLTALMKIIAATNSDVQSRHEAVVKNIESVMIGRSAIGKSGEVMRLSGTTGGMGGMGMEAGMAMGMDSGMGNDEFGGNYDDSSGNDPNATNTPASRDPGNGRYVDNDYQPLTAERVRTAFQSENAEEAFLVVAKRMPVRLDLVVDQRKLHRLLAECGNSKLPLEVRQVRINRKGATSNRGGGGGMDYGSGMMDQSYADSDSGDEYGADYAMDLETDMGAESSGLMDSPYGGDSTGSVKRAEVSTESPYDVPVELYGIIYIYNPVDKQKLGIDDLESAAPVEPAEPVPTSAG